MSIATTLLALVAGWWGDLEQVGGADAETALSFLGTLARDFAADQLAILAGAARQVVADLAADPLLVLTPEAELTALLNYLAGQEVVELSRVTAQVSAALIATAKLEAAREAVTAAP